MKEFIQKLKIRWGIKNNVQVLLIFIVFALCGTTTLRVEAFISEWLNIPHKQSFWVDLALFIFLTIPLYNILLIIIGSLFGQFKFFWNFEKKFFKSITKLFFWNSNSHKQ